MKDVKIDVDKKSGHITSMAEMEHACRILVGKHDEKRPLEGTCRWVGNNKMDLIGV
jgi:hypothetical protein